jgi:hemerythrin
MEFIKWDNGMSVNIISIDNQHKKLIEEINNFCNGLKSKRSKEVLSDIIYQLSKYSIYHFQTEESLMKKYGFPGFKEHKAEHDKFIEKIQDLETRFKLGKLILTIEIANFLKDWLSNHVLNTDKEYTKFLNDCGVK